MMLDLPAFGEVLAEWLGKQDHWRPNVQKFSLNLLDDLKPRSYTRDLEWGIPVPLDGWRDRPDKSIYVWFDAVVGYLSASIQWAQLTGDPEAWRAWWQNPDARGYYFMGKDNIVFHAEIWPAMLIGYSGIGAKGGTPGSLGALDLPYEVVSSEFLTMEGRKFSSSRSVVIYVGDMLSRYDADALRYYLAVAGPENQDTDFTWSEFVRRNNDELVAGWGNLVNRTLSMTAKNLGTIPAPGELTDADRTLLNLSRDAFGGVGELLARSRQKAAIGDVMGVVVGGEQVPVGHGAVEAEEQRPGQDGVGAARGAAGRRRREDDADAVPAVVVVEGRGHAARDGAVGGDARPRRGRRADRGRVAVVLGADRRLRHRRALGVGPDRGRPAAAAADAGLHQARPGGRRTRNWPGSPRRRDDRRLRRASRWRCRCSTRTRTWTRWRSGPAWPPTTPSSPASWPTRGRWASSPR